MKISATIITFNEEANIARAVKSLSFVDEIIILDSNSTDKTREIANELGAKTFLNPFVGYGQQKNKAAEYANHSWILNIDADEEVSPELADEIKKIISQNENSNSIYQLNRRTNYCGKWIYHGGWYPDLIKRLYHKNQAKWTEPFVHEELLPIGNSGQIGFLNGNLNHYSFPTIKSQVLTNVKYAELGAKELIKKKGKRPTFFEMLFRPIGKFFECYFIKLGLLDGAPGFIIAVNAAYSMFMKYSFARYEREIK